MELQLSNNVKLIWTQFRKITKFYKGVENNVKIEIYIKLQVLAYTNMQLH